MDLNFGHGFLARVGRDNYKAVDRCLGPGELWADPLDLPWAIVDGAWAEPNATVLDPFSRFGTKVLVDTEAWRYRFPETYGVAKMAGASWTPASPIDLADRAALGQLVRESLWAQAKLGADAYLVPGFHPSSGSEDLRAVYDEILAVVERFSDIPAKPLVLYLGVHSNGIELGSRLMGNLPAFLSGLYVQVTPLDAVHDGPSKLERIAHLYIEALAHRLPVIAGHGGAITPMLRALGVHAADAGLATGETFDMNSAKNRSTPPEDGKKQSGGPSARMYLREVGRSLDNKVVKAYLSVPAVRDLLSTCTLPCHRFAGGDPLARAKEHSLRARVDEARAITDTTRSMRMSTILDLLEARRSTVTMLNGALAAASLPPLDPRPADNHHNWFSRHFAQRPAA